MNSSRRTVLASLAGAGFLSAGLAGLVASPPLAAASRRSALVIGNAAYPELPLRNPGHDARAMASELRRLGFHVDALLDADYEAMRRAIRRFGRSLGQGVVGLFYYAGHGMQLRGENYLLPVDASINAERAVRLESIALDMVLSQMTLEQDAMNIVILDACRNNPFERRFRSAAGGLASVDAPLGTLLAYATAPGSVAIDGVGPNGVYTAALLNELRIANGRRIEDVFKSVRANVVQHTNGYQVPWESSSLIGDFYFSGHSGSPGSAEPMAFSRPAPARRRSGDTPARSRDATSIRRRTFTIMP